MLLPAETRFQQGGKVGSGRRAAARRCVPGRAWVGALAAFRAPVYCLSAPPFTCNTVSKEVRCTYQRTLGDAPAALSRVPAVPLLATVSNTTTGEALRPRPTSPDRATSVRQAQTRLYAPFTCKVGVSSEERLSRKKRPCAFRVRQQGPCTLHGYPATTRTAQRPQPSELVGGPAGKLPLYNLGTSQKKPVPRARRMSHAAPSLSRQPAHEPC